MVGKAGRSVGMIKAVLAAVLVVLLVVAVAVVPVQAGKRTKSRKDLRCSVCQRVLETVQKGIDETKETHEIQVGFRLDEKKRVQYARSEFRILEVMDDVCSKKLSTFVPIVLEANKLDAALPKAIVNRSGFDGPLDTLEDTKLARRQVRRECDRFMDNFTDQVLAHFHNSRPDVFDAICVKLAAVCDPSALPPAVPTEWPTQQSDSDAEEAKEEPTKEEPAKPTAGGEKDL